MRSRRPTHRLRLDTLEARLTPAGNVVTAVTAAGDVKITGDNVDNAFSVFLNGTDWFVSGINGTTIDGAAFVTLPIPANGFRNVSIATKNVATGGDFVRLLNLSHTGNLKVTGGTGDDTIILVDHVAGGNVAIAAKGGENTVNVIGTPGGTNDAPTATTTVGKNLTITGTTGDDSFGVVGALVAGNLKAAASKGANYIALSEVAVTGKTTLAAGKDADAVHVGLDAANGDDLFDTGFGNVFLGKVAISTGAGNDAVIAQNARFGSTLTAKLAAGDDGLLETGNTFTAGGLVAIGKTRAGGGTDVIYSPLNLGAADLKKLQFEATNDGNEADLIAAVRGRLTGPVRTNFEDQGINLDGGPNDTIAEAIALGDPVDTPAAASGVIDGAGKGVLMYAISGIAGDRYEIDIDNLSDGFDSYLRVFSAAGAELAFDDDEAAPGEQPSFESYIPFTLPSNGTFYVGVSGLANINYNPVTGTGDTSGSRGSFDLLITHLGDETTATATALGDPSAGGFNVSGFVGGRGVEMWSLALQAGDVLNLDVDAEQGLTDSFLRLFDSAGAEVASNDDTDGPLPEFDPEESFLTYNVTTTGTYYVGVSVYFNTGYDAVTGAGDIEPFNGGGGFTLDVSLTTNGGPNDQIPEAISLGDVVDNSATASGTIDDGGQAVIMYSFTGAFHDYYDIDIDNLTGGLDTFIRVFDSAGNVLATNDDGAAPGEGSTLESYLRFRLPATGTYYVGVSDLGNTFYDPLTGAGDFPADEGTYTITISNSADGAINDNFVNLGDPFFGMFTVTGTVGGRGVLMWSVDLLAGDELNIDLDSLGLADSILRLFDGDGNEVAFSDDDAGPGAENNIRESFIQYNVTAGGRYFIGVSAFSNETYNPLDGTGDESAGSNGGDFTMDIFLSP